jgi:flagellar hook-length control protein FliK
LSAAVAEIAAAKASDAEVAPTTATGQVALAPNLTVATSAAAPVAAPAGTPAGTAAQLAPTVFAVHQRGVEGTHHMTVDITPDELGPVRLTVALRDGQLHVLLAGSSEMSREAMRAALPELRKLVEGAGITAGSFDVHPDQPDPGRFGPGTNGSFPGTSSDGSGSPGHPPPDPGRPDQLQAAAPERRGPSAANRSLDLQL